MSRCRQKLTWKYNRLSRSSGWLGSCRPTFIKNAMFRDYFMVLYIKKLQASSGSDEPLPIGCPPALRPWAWSSEVGLCHLLCWSSAPTVLFLNTDYRSNVYESNQVSRHVKFPYAKRKSAVNMKKRTNLSVNSVEKFISSNSYLSQIGIGLKIVFLLLFFSKYLFPSSSPLPSGWIYWNTL